MSDTMLNLAQTRLNQNKRRINELNRQIEFLRGVGEPVDALLLEYNKAISDIMQYQKSLESAKTIPDVFEVK